MKNTIYNLIATVVIVFVTGGIASAIPNIEPVENHPQVVENDSQIKDSNQSYVESNVTVKGEADVVQVHESVENSQSSKLIEKIDQFIVPSPQYQLVVRLYEWAHNEQQNESHLDTVVSEKGVYPVSYVKHEPNRNQYLINVEKEVSHARCCFV